MRLGATVQRDDAAEAQGALNAVMQQAIQSIRQLGIDAADVATSGISLMPVYSGDSDLRERSVARERPPEELARRSNEPEIVGYRATNVVRVTVEDLARLGSVVDAAIAAGANEVRGISFGLQDELPHRIIALQRAVEAAAQKARAAASALGVRITEPLEVREQGGFVPYRELDAGVARAGLAADTPIEPGEIQIEASVEVQFGVDTSTFRSGVD